MKIRHFFTLACSICILACSHQQAPEILIMGASSTVEYPHSSEQSGWPQHLEALCTKKVTFVNRTHSGESARTYAQKGLLNKALQHNPRWVFIQFAHNDLSQKIPPLEYKEDMRHLVHMCKEMGAQVIIVTPQQWIRYENENLLPVLDEYAHELHALANEENVALVDLFEHTNEIFSKQSPAENKEYLLDNLHFSRYGAADTANFVKNELIKQNLELGDYFR